MLVCFEIDTDGSVVNVRIHRGVHELLDKESIRVISIMPKWKPALTKGEPVKSRMIMPINFSLE